MRTVTCAALLVLCLPSAAWAEPAGDPPVTPAPEAPEPAPAPVAAPEPAPAPVPAPAREPAVHTDDEPRAAEAASYGDSLVLAGGSQGSPRAIGNNWLLLPKGNLEVGGDLAFLTSETTARKIEFTDVGLMSLRARRGFGRLELGGSATLLIKQPSYFDSEPFVQVLSLDARLAAGTRHAVALAVSGGPLMADQGLWGSADFGLQAKRIMHETLVFEGGLGGSFTDIALKGRERPFWFAEVSAGASAIIRVPNGMAAMFVGSELHVPVAFRPRSAHPDTGTGQYLDPGTRLNFSVGGVYSVVDNWDLMVSYAIIDRGDTDKPATTLPILAGGFDAREMIFTVVHRFEKKAKQRGPYYIAE